ncbi:NAD-binding protein [Haloarcula sp. JP-L23]|uniref:NAD-binding protein n=1 Tax=Haloarcula sp. JP-L23 TaxID=2716717 RepID=UPI00140EF2A6|nr:hypothetical protein G9465_19335 [Haloarcula sp. JP-L23]
MTSRIRDAFDHTTGPPRLLVVGDSHIVSAAATELAADIDVRLLTNHDGVVGQSDIIQVTVGDVTDIETLEAAGAAGADAALVALGTDRQTLLVAHLIRAHFNIDAITVLVANPNLRDVFDGIATAVVPGATVLADELYRQVTTTLRVTESA